MGEQARTRNYVVFTHADAEDIVGKARRYEKLALALRDQMEAEHTLLIVALAELAAERGSRDREHFIRTWLRQHHNVSLPYWFKGAPTNGA